MAESLSRQSIVDEEHLKLLSLGYLISAGTTAFFSLFGLLYVLMGILVVTVIPHNSGATAKAGQQPPAFMGWFISGIGLAFFLVAIGVAALKVRASSCIKQRRSRTFCMVIAGISCLEVPYGTILGILSFIVFGRESVIQLFDTGATLQPSHEP